MIRTMLTPKKLSGDARQRHAELCAIQKSGFLGLLTAHTAKNLWNNQSQCIRSMSLICAVCAVRRPRITCVRFVRFTNFEVHQIWPVRMNKPTDCRFSSCFLDDWSRKVVCCVNDQKGLLGPVKIVYSMIERDLRTLIFPPPRFILNPFEASFYNESLVTCL
jgi:hypothetical protein